MRRVGKVDDLVKALGADTGISKSEVSRICKDLDTEVAAFRDRPLGDQRFPYVFLEASEPTPTPNTTRPPLRTSTVPLRGWVPQPTEKGRNTCHSSTGPRTLSSTAKEVAENLATKAKEAVSETVDEVQDAARALVDKAAGVADHVADKADRIADKTGAVAAKTDHIANKTGAVAEKVHGE